ncbi:MAG TPA: MarC family NAAT transporter [Opitutaceae bacterium]|jgi:multiple antibiotic resistance protein|nr:MarC family NAAT transporter [Opitutaceae bacterium]
MNAPHFWQLILGTVVALLPVINPVASAPVVLTITEGDTDARRTQQVKRGCCYMVVILVSCLFSGSFIIRFFGISIPGIRIAGGLLVSGIAMSMLAPPRQEAGERRRREEARAKGDISLTPLAMPMLSGPGSIALTIGFTSLADHWLDYAAIILGIVIVAIISYVVLRLSGRMVGLVGANGMNALTKFMGFLLLCIGVQFVVNGVTNIATDPVLLQSIRSGLAR